MENNYDIWFRKGDDDELSARAVLEKGAPGIACFLSEQLAEKYLKGLLVARLVSFPKVHDLLELETLLLKTDPPVNKIHSDLELLNRYYAATRYPGDYPEVIKEEAEAAFAAALRVKEFVLQTIGKTRQ